jgi:hypothetical protein
MKEGRIIPNALFFAEMEEHFRQGRGVEMNHKGFSMRPFLKSGRDVILLKPIGVDNLHKGMVVLFRHRGMHTLHRYRGRLKDGRLRMVGDGNYRQEEIVLSDDVVAYVAEVKKGGCRLRYGSLCWRLMSAWSLVIKCLRTVAIDVKRKIKG